MAGSVVWGLRVGIYGSGWVSGVPGDPLGNLAGENWSGSAPRVQEEQRRVDMQTIIDQLRLGGEQTRDRFLTGYVFCSIWFNIFNFIPISRVWAIFMDLAAFALIS